MIKIRRIFDFPTEINFNSPTKEFELYGQSFLVSELGLIYQSIPWKEIIQSMKNKEYRKGPHRMFNPQGMLGLMFFKVLCRLFRSKTC